jgi:hypothetical protein
VFTVCEVHLLSAAAPLCSQLPLSVLQARLEPGNGGGIPLGCGRRCIKLGPKAFGTRRCIVTGGAQLRPEAVRLLPSCRQACLRAHVQQRVAVIMEPMSDVLLWSRYMVPGWLQMVPQPLVTHRSSQMNLRCGEAGLEVRCLAARCVERALMGCGCPLGGGHSVPQRRCPTARQQRLPLQGLNPFLQ